MQESNLLTDRFRVSIRGYLHAASSPAFSVRPTSRFFFSAISVTKRHNAKPFSGRGRPENTTGRMAGATPTPGPVHLYVVRVRCRQCNNTRRCCGCRAKRSRRNTGGTRPAGGADRSTSTRAQRFGAGARAAAGSSVSSRFSWAKPGQPPDRLTQSQVA